MAPVLLCPDRMTYATLLVVLVLLGTDALKGHHPFLMVTTMLIESEK